MKTILITLALCLPMPIATVAWLEWTRIEPVERTDADGPALPERWAPGTYWDRRGDLEDGR